MFFLYRTADTGTCARYAWNESASPSAGLHGALCHSLQEAGCAEVPASAPPGPFTVLVTVPQLSGGPSFTLLRRYIALLFKFFTVDLFFLAG